MSCECNGPKMTISPNSPVFDVDCLLILVRAERISSTFKCDSASVPKPCCFWPFSTFAAFQRWQEIYMTFYLDIWPVNWFSVTLGHLCFRGKDFTVKARSPPLQAVWALEQLILHGWCFWTRLQSMQDPLIPGGLANHCLILLASVRISSSSYLSNVLC